MPFAADLIPVVLAGLLVWIGVRRAGDWAFAVTAVDMAGNESDFSEPLTVEVGP